MEGDGGSAPPDDIRMRRRRVEVAGVVLPDDTTHELRDAIKELTRQNGQTAVILERLTNRIDTVDEWRKQQDKRQEDAANGRKYQRFWHTENQSGDVRGYISIGIAICAMLINLLPHLHWG